MRTLTTLTLAAILTACATHQPTYTSDQANHDLATCQATGLTCHIHYDNNGNPTDVSGH